MFFSILCILSPFFFLTFKLNSLGALQNPFSAAYGLALAYLFGHWNLMSKPFFRPISMNPFTHNRAVTCRGHMEQRKQVAEFEEIFHIFKTQRPFHSHKNLLKWSFPTSLIPRKNQRDQELEYSCLFIRKFLFCQFHFNSQGGGGSGCICGEDVSSAMPRARQITCDVYFI